MASVRRDPTTPDITYMDIEAIAAEIRDLKIGGPEGDISGVWNAILNWVFDVFEGYITRPQAKHTEYGGKKGYSDFHTLQRTETGQRFFLITQCKARMHEGHTTTWEEGAEQLQRYLSMQHGYRAVKNRTSVYGILAVGKRVRFFKYKDTTQSVEGWHPGIARDEPQDELKQDKKQHYDIAKEANLVQRALLEILREHLCAISHGRQRYIMML